MTEEERSVSEERKIPGWLLPVGIGVAIAVLVTIALVRQPLQLDPTTPEGTVQEYLQAFADGRYEDAFAVLDPDSFPGCDAADLARVASYQTPFTASLQEPQLSTEGTRALVTVVMRHGEGGGPFGVGGWESQETFSLFLEDDFWWVTGEPWPYFVYECAGPFGEPIFPEPFEERG